jgi:hypothetical protein
MPVEAKGRHAGRRNELPACRRVTPIRVDDNRRGKRLLPAREWHCSSHMPPSLRSKHACGRRFPASWPGQESRAVGLGTRDIGQSKATEIQNITWCL